MNDQGPSVLRNKAVHLLYLIFLVMVFTFIPSDFIQSVDRSNSALKELCVQSQKQTEAFSQLALSYLKDNQSVYEITTNQIAYLDELIHDQTENIDILIEELEASSNEQHASISLTRSQQSSNELLLKQNQAHQLFGALSDLKSELYRYIEPEDIDLLDTLLPLHEFEKNANGRTVKTEAFYFENYPLTISILNLIGFKARLGLVHNLATFTMLNNALIEANIELPADVLRTFNLDDGLQTSSTKPLNLLSDSTASKSDYLNKLDQPLYSDLLNQLDLQRIGVYDDTKIDVTATNAEIKWLNKECFIMPTGLSAGTIFINDKATKQSLYELSFTVTNPPTPTIALAGFETAQMPQNVARTARLVTLNTHGISALESCTIASYSMSIFYKNQSGILSPIRNTSTELNSASVSALSTIQSGDLLLFTDIVGKTPNGKTVEILPITYKIQ